MVRENVQKKVCITNASALYDGHKDPKRIHMISSLN